MNEGQPVTKGQIDSIRPSNQWIMATNQTHTSWEDTSNGANAIIYWDLHLKELKGLVYSYHKDSSPWSQGDKYYLYFDAVLKTTADLKAYRASRPPSSKGRWASAWDKRWGVTIYGQKGVQVNDTVSIHAIENDKGVRMRMLLGEFFKEAKQNPYKFIPPEYGEWGVLNHKFMFKWEWADSI